MGRALRIGSPQTSPMTTNMIFDKVLSKSVTAKSLGLHYADYSQNTDMDPEESLLPHLHGTLVIRIEEARDLPDVDSSWWQSSKNVSDPFAKVYNSPPQNLFQFPSSKS